MLRMDKGEEYQWYISPRLREIEVGVGADGRTWLVEST